MTIPPVDHGDRIYYSISEVSEMTGLEPHVLRYWEREISDLRPRRGERGVRRYRPTDVDDIFEIKRLVYEEGYSIPGAGARLAEMKRGVARPQNLAQFRKVLDEIEAGLLRLAQEIDEELESHPPGQTSSDPVQEG